MHNKSIRVGIRMLVFGFALSFLGIAIQGVLLPLGLILLVIGFWIASRSPVVTDILKVEKRCVYLQRVHPDFMKLVPYSDGYVEAGVSDVAELE